MDYTFFKQVIETPAVQISFTLLSVLVLQYISRQAVEHLVKRTVRSHKYSSRLDEQKRESTLIKIFQINLLLYRIRPILTKMPLPQTPH